MSNEKTDALTSTVFAYLATKRDRDRHIIVKNLLLVLSNGDFAKAANIRKEELDRWWDMMREADELWYQSEGGLASSFELAAKATNISDEVARQVFSKLPPSVLVRASQKLGRLPITVPIREGARNAEDE